MFRCAERDFPAIWQLSQPVFVGVSVDLTHNKGNGEDSKKQRRRQKKTPKGR
jgi:hypothetical protein